MKNILFLLVYTVAYVLQLWVFQTDKITSIYFALALILLLFTRLLGRIAKVKEVEKGLVFLAFSTIRFFLFLSALLPTLLHRTSLDVSKGAAIALTIPLFLTVVYDALNTVKEMSKKTP